MDTSSGKNHSNKNLRNSTSSEHDCLLGQDYDQTDADVGEIYFDFRYGSFPRVNSWSSTASTQSYITRSNSTVSQKLQHSIRFQVVVWHVGSVDAVLGKVDMRFRVTIFWNAPEDFDDEDGYGMHNNPLNKKVWTMHGRQRAYRRELNDVIRDSHMIYVPPVSILNAIDFETLGDPEICLIDNKKKLFKWSCLYKATLAQEKMQVAEFPHDIHDLIIRFGVVKHRQHRKRWDKNRWKLALATIKDTQDTIRVPHGLIVDHVRVPGFSHDHEDGLRFEFIPLNFGGGKKNSDTCLQVKLQVRRDSSYYDRNIMPLLAALHIVAISTLAMSASDYGNRGQMVLATSFVEIGIRMTLDSRLPVVGYQIKMQSALNQLFWGLLFIALMSSISYIAFWSKTIISIWIDLTTAILALIHLIWILRYYYKKAEDYNADEYPLARPFKSNDSESDSVATFESSEQIEAKTPLSTNGSKHYNPPPALLV